MEAVEALQVLFAGSACLELMIAEVLGWLFLELMSFQLAGFGLLSVPVLVGLGHHLHLAAFGC
jgi:hypothetical protein